MRILAHASLGVRNPHLVEPREGPFARLALGEAKMEPQGLGDLLADPHMRRQGGERVLEDHGHLRPAQPVQRLGLEPEQLLAVEPGRAGGHAVVGQKPHDGHEGLALAGAALADHAQALAGHDVQADPAHGGNDPVGGGEVHLQVVEGQDRLGGQETGSGAGSANCSGRGAAINAKHRTGRERQGEGAAPAPPETVGYRVCFAVAKPAP
jgi:hypothetical protein